MFSKLLVLAAAVTAMPMVQIDNLNPAVPSIARSVAELARVVAEVNVFNGNWVDIRTVTRDTKSALQTVDDIANEISNGPRFDEVEAAAVVGALPPIFVQLDLLSQALIAKKVDLRSPAFLEQSTGLVDNVADTMNDLVGAVDGVAPQNWVKIFHDVNQIFINKIHNLRNSVSPRPLAFLAPRPAYAPAPVVVPAGAVTVGIAPPAAAPFEVGH